MDEDGRGPQLTHTEVRVLGCAIICLVGFVALAMKLAGPQFVDEPPVMVYLDAGRG
jgi:hypothetical protein